MINGERNHAHKHSHHVELVYFPEILAPGPCHYLSKNPVINLCLFIYLAFVSLDSKARSYVQTTNKKLQAK